MKEALEPAPGPPWAWLAFGSVVQTVLLGVLFTVPFFYLWSVMPEPPPETGPATDGNWQQALAIAIIFGAPTLLPFLLFVRQPRAGLPTSIPLILVAALVALIVLPGLVSLLTYPCCAGDVMDYVNRQRLWTAYGGNPFAVVPDDYPLDWSYYLARKDSVFGYGPLWWIIVRGCTQWATNLGQYLVGLKILGAVCFGVSLRLIWLLSPPERRPQNLVFFAWNPIVLVDGLVRLHNDLLTVPFVLAAVWVFQRRAALSLPMVALGALIKLIVAPVGLVVLTLLLRARDWRAIVLGSAASLMIIVGLYAPFWYGLGTLSTLVTQANRAQWSVGSVLMSAAAPVLGDVTVPVVRLVLLAVALLLSGVCLQHFLTQPSQSTATVAACAALLLLIGMLAIPLAFYSHYLTPVIGLAAAAADRRLRSLVLVLSFGTMVNTLMGVDQLAGGVSGSLMGAIGCAVLLTALGLGVLYGWRSSLVRPIGGHRVRSGARA